MGSTKQLPPLPAVRNVSVYKLSPLESSDEAQVLVSDHNNQTLRCRILKFKVPWMVDLSPHIFYCTTMFQNTLSFPTTSIRDFSKAITGMVPVFYQRRTGI